MPWSRSRAVVWKIAGAVEPRLGAERSPKQIFLAVERAAGELGTVPLGNSCHAPCHARGEPGCRREVGATAAPSPPPAWEHLSHGAHGVRDTFPGCLERKFNTMISAWPRVLQLPQEGHVWGCTVETVAVPWGRDGDGGWRCLGQAGLSACGGMLSPLRRVGVQPVRGMRGCALGERSKLSVPRQDGRKRLCRLPHVQLLLRKCWHLQQPQPVCSAETQTAPGPGAAA